jgi:hypothetical protein
MKNKMKTEETYTSRDLALVAYLVASGFPLESYEKDKEGLVLFTFPMNSQLHEFITKFYHMTALVNPTMYNNTLRGIKSMLYESGRQNKTQDEYYEKRKLQ